MFNKLLDKMVSSRPSTVLVVWFIVMAAMCYITGEIFLDWNDLPEVVR